MYKCLEIAAAARYIAKFNSTRTSDSGKTGSSTVTNSYAEYTTHHFAPPPQIEILATLLMASVIISLPTKSPNTLVFLQISGSSPNSKGVTRGKALYETEVGTNWLFSTFNHRISEMVQDMTKVAIDH